MVMWIKMRKIVSLLGSAVFIAVLAVQLVFAADPAEGETHVVILGTSDIHGNIWGWTYEDGTETTNSGMARLYTYIEQVREEYPCTFLINGGDEIQGSILTDYIAKEHLDQPHPVIAAMNYMGYDAMTLGNHEFNWGVPNLQKILSTAEFPVLGQNVLNKDGSYLTGDGWVIIERGGIRLAVIGAVTPDVPMWDGTHDGVAELTFEPGGESVKKAIEEIGDQADIIMVSAHMGMYSEFDEENGSDSAQIILDENPEIDVLQVGHFHITVQEKQGDTVIGGVRNSGREIARFDLTLDADKNITSSEVAVIDMADYEPSEEIRAIPVVKEMHQEALDLVTGGENPNEDTTPLGSTTEKFQPENEISGFPEALVRDTPVVDLILNVELANSGADVAATALFRTDSDLPEGDIYYSDIYRIYKYNNEICRVTVTGAELKAYMEWSAGFYNQWNPGDINISFNPEIPMYLYDMFAGVDYEINLSKPAGERVENIMFHGEPLRDDQTLTLAVNNYRYSSALKALDLVAGKMDWISSNYITDMLVDYFAANSPVEPTVDNNWKITGIDLSKDDPRRAELIGYINEGLLSVPFNESYNLDDYDELVALAEKNRESGEYADPEDVSTTGKRGG